MCRRFLLLATAIFCLNRHAVAEPTIDIGLTACQLAEEVNRDVNVSACSTTIGELADKVRLLVRDREDPDFRVRCLNTVLLRDEKFCATRRLSSQSPGHQYLPELLRTKEGNCFSMPVLYVAVAQRLDWPIVAVSLPDHCFVRYVDERLKEQNIETTSNGGFASDDAYARDFSVSKIGRKKGVYLRSLTNQELVGELIALNGITLGLRGDLTAAIAHLERAVLLNPRSTGAVNNLRIAYERMAQIDTVQPAQYASKAQRCKIRLKHMGYVEPKSIPYLVNAGGKKE